MNINNPAILAAITTLPNKDTILNEAAFGFEYVRPYIEKLPKGARILEVGSGPCVLLSHLSALYPDHHFTGIEPIGDGFNQFRQSIQTLTKEFSIDLFAGAYEDFNNKQVYDLIFLVKVFEHLPNWKHFLGFVQQKLHENGAAVILCPNYSFPYEPHFRIPILFNKSITFRLLKKYITRFEVKNNVVGLWSSLNFVKLRQVKDACIQLQLQMTSYPTITEDMIQRLDTDTAFSERQKFAGVIARLLNRIGVTRFLIRKFPSFNPYMYLEIKKA